MTRRRITNELNQRYREILGSIVREFVRSGSPVGSRRLSKINREHLSAATVRNVVADLEEMGFVEQPHTSAGRIPTAKGYRFFVDRLSSSRKLSDRQVDRIRKSLEAENNPGDLMSKTSQILSDLSDNVGFVLVPPMSQAIIKHIDFVKISPRRVLVILVSQRGLVQHRIIEVPEELGQDALDQAGRHLVRNYEGQTLVAVRDELARLMSQDRARYDRLFRNAVLLGCWSLLDTDEGVGSEVYLGGTSHIIEKVKMVDRDKLIGLFQAFEEKSRLVKILNECVRPDRIPSVTIGLEKHLPGMDDFTLISAPYPFDRGVTGTLGILGPSRMEYEKTIGLVDSMAQLFGNLLADKLRRSQEGR